MVLECADGVIDEVGDTEGVLDREAGEDVMDAVVEMDGVLLAVGLCVGVRDGVGATLLVGVYVVWGDAPGNAVGVVTVVSSNVMAAMRASRRPVMAALLPTVIL